MKFRLQPYRIFFLLICLSTPAAQSEENLATSPLSDFLTLPFIRKREGFLIEKHPYLMPGILIPKSSQDFPRFYVPSLKRSVYNRYPWKKNISTTVFWVGEKPTPRNPTPNSASSWDPKWVHHFGGFDDPESRDGWRPSGFIPRQNPFYIALPYNDTAKLRTKSSARKCIPWFEEMFYRDGKSVLKGRWVAIKLADRVCYGQWEDCGPFDTDDWRYVFGNSRPRNPENKGAGLDVSPAIRDYLGFRWNASCDWRFVESYEVPDGPWKKWGDNNPFALKD